MYNYHFDQMSTASSALNSMGKNTYPYPYTIGNVNITSAPGPLMGYTSYGYLSNLPNNYYNNVFTFHI